MQSLDQSLLDNQNATQYLFHAGAYLKKRFNKKVRFHGGISIQNLPISDATVPLTFMAYGQWAIKKSKKISWHPSFLLQTQNNIYNAVAMMGIRDSKFLNKNISIEYRLGHRFRDALIAGLSVDWGQWEASMHYDMTLSSARNYNGLNGAFELGMSRTFIIYPKVKEKIIHICPRL